MALGVGVAIGLGHGTAWADDAKGTSAGATGGSSSSTSDPAGGSPASSAGTSTASGSTEAHDPGPTSEPSAPEDSQGDIKTGSSDESSKEKTAKSARSNRPSRSTAAESRSSTTEAESESGDSARAARSDASESAESSESAEAPETGASTFATGSSSTDELASAKQLRAVAVPAAAAVVRAPATATKSVGAVTSAVSSLIGGGGNTGADSPLTWVVAAAARREIGVSDADSVASVAAQVSTGEPAKAAGATMRIASLAAVAPNSAPVISALTVGTPNPSTGVASGKATAGDVDGDTVKYAATAVKGAVAMNATTGAFTYTPTAAARHAASATGATPADKAGSVTVTVTDGKGGSATKTVAVSLVPVNAAPVVTMGAGTPNATTGVVTGWVKGADTDWDTLAYGAPATTTKGAVVINAGTGAFTYTPTQAARLAAGAATTATDPAKTDTFTVTVTDGHTGGTVTKAVTVTVAPNKAPTPLSVTVNTPNPTTGVVTGSVKATDPDKDVLKFTTPASTAKGALSINASTGEFTFTPTQAARQTAATSTSAANKSETFTVTITDSKGASATQAVTVAIVPNKAPTGAGVTVGTPNATTGVVTGTVAATDPDGDALKYSAPATAAKGAISLNTATGAFTYTPSAAARHAATLTAATSADKADTFTVTITDTKGAAITKTVTVPILGKNTAPVVNLTVGAPNSTTGVVTGSIKGADAENDAITYTAPNSTTKGSVGINGTTGAFTYTPTQAARQAAAAAVTATDPAKTDTFTVTVADGHTGGTVTKAVTVSIAPNRAPTGASFTASTPNSTTGVVTGTVKASDPDNDALKYTAPATTAKGAVSINASTGAFTFTPTQAARHAAATAASADKQDTFTVTITDAKGAAITKTVTVPVLGKNAPLTAATPAVGSPNAANGVVTGSVKVTDPDGDVITFGSPITTAKGTVIVDSTGKLIYQPTDDARRKAGVLNAPAADKQDTFTLIADDGHGSTVPISVTVSIAALNTAPTPGAVNVGNPDGNGVVIGSVTASDVNGDPLTFSKGSDPGKGSVSVATNGAFTYTPSAAGRQQGGTDLFSVTVDDGHGGTASMSVTVTVLPAPPPPPSGPTLSQKVDAFVAEWTGRHVGAGWCVDLIVRYLSEVFGVSNPYGNASDYKFGDDSNADNAMAAAGFQWHAGNIDGIQNGDILVWSGQPYLRDCSTDGCGHIAIFYHNQVWDQNDGWHDPHALEGLVGLSVANYSGSFSRVNSNGLNFAGYWRPPGGSTGGGGGGGGSTGTSGKKNGTATVIQLVNVRNDPSTNGPIIAQYSPGQTFNYDSWVIGNGYYWLSYISYTGVRRYVAEASADGKVVFVRGGVFH